jgi:FkbM family methyltransferase
MKLIKKIIKKILFILGFEKIFYEKKYYSQDGEDILLQSFFVDKGREYKGFYIDIGAHHPMRFSNTYVFYKKGWKGINIDATPGSMKEFNRVRKRDINIEAGISDSYGELEYYSFHEPALNSFNKAISEERIKSGCKLKEIIVVETFSINDILDKFISKKQNIDFITIDIEGLDLIVLQSLNFDKYAPEFFVVEDSDFISKDIIEYSKSSIYCFLKQKEYKPIVKTRLSVIYKKQGNVEV